MNSIIEKYMTLQIDTKSFISFVLNDNKLLNEISMLLPTDKTSTEDKWKNFPYMLSLKTHCYDFNRLVKCRFSNGVNPSGKSGLYDFMYKILTINGFSFEYNEYYKNRFRLLMDIVPEYIGGNEAEQYIDSFISNLPSSFSEIQKKQAIKKMIKDLFLCKNKVKPKWVQEPEWAIADKPMVFLSQRNIGDKYIYVFEDRTTGNLKEIIQYK